MKKLNVMGQKVSVKIKKIDDSSDSVAQYDPETNSIIIDPRYSNKGYSYIHELIHAAWDRAGLCQTDVSSNIQEIICETLATVIGENIVTISQTFNKLNKMDITS